MAISARSNGALSRFWAGILCLTVLGVGVLELMGAPLEKAQEVTRADSAVVPVPTSAKPDPAAVPPGDSANRPANAVPPPANAVPADEAAAAKSEPAPIPIGAASQPPDAVRALGNPAMPSEAMPADKTAAAKLETGSIPIGAASRSSGAAFGPDNAVMPSDEIAAPKTASSNAVTSDPVRPPDETTFNRAQSSHQPETRLPHRGYHRHATPSWSRFLAFEPRAYRPRFLRSRTGNYYFLRGSARAL